MIPKYSLGLAALALVIAASGAAQAPTPTQAPLELVGYVKLEKVTTDETGARTIERVDPQVVVPGDKLIFGTRFANKGPEPVEQFVVSNPVPAAVRVSGEVDAEQLVSVDGGKVWGKLADLSTIDPAGQPRAALPGDITNVRWILPQIAPGESGTLEFPVTVR